MQSPNVELGCELPGKTLPMRVGYYQVIGNYLVITNYLTHIYPLQKLVIGNFLVILGNFG